MAKLRRINQDDLRNHNLSVVLNTMLRSTTPLSRADLAKETGLTKATMSLLTTLLLDNDVVCEGAPLVQSVFGRPSTPLNIQGGSICGIGIQINTDGYGYLVLDLDGSVIAERWINDDLHDVDATELFTTLDTMLLEQERILSDQGYIIAGTGLALPGLVTEDQHLLMARNLGWEHLNLHEFPLIERLNVITGNEANMAAIAQLPGYASQRLTEGIVGPNTSFVYISTDIGIGGAIVRDGHVEDGVRGFNGEFGHLSVQMDGPLCRCGRRGCVEAYAGRRSMIELADIAHGAEATSPQALDELFRRLDEGDPHTLEVAMNALYAMESMITSAVNITDVNTIMLGGHWAKIGSKAKEHMLHEVQTSILARDAVQVRIVCAKDLARPALVGAALTGLRKFIDNPLIYLQ